MASAQIDSSKGPLRKRGRPSGKNRVPLSVEERRARNAHYERERRNETSEAMSDLAQAIGCLPGTSNADILATVVNYLQNSAAIDPSDDITRLRHINDKLIYQIHLLEHRLETEPDPTSQTSFNNQPSDEDDSDQVIRTHNNKTDSKRMKMENINSKAWFQQEEEQCQTMTTTNVLPNVSTYAKSNELTVSPSVREAAPNQFEVTCNRVYEVATVKPPTPLCIFPDTPSPSGTSSTSSEPAWSAFESLGSYETDPSSHLSSHASQEVWSPYSGSTSGQYDTTAQLYPSTSTSSANSWSNVRISSQCQPSSSSSYNTDWSTPSSAISQAPMSNLTWPSSQIRQIPQQQATYPSTSHPSGYSVQMGHTGQPTSQHTYPHVQQHIQQTGVSSVEMYPQNSYTSTNVSSLSDALPADLQDIQLVHDEIFEYYKNWTLEDLLKYL